MERTKKPLKSVQYDEQHEPMVLPMVLLDMLLQHDNASDLIALYIFYYHTAKWQKTIQPKATIAYVAYGLHWSEDRVRKIKKILIEIGLVKEIVVRGDSGRVVGQYIKLILGTFSFSTTPPSCQTQRLVSGEDKCIGTLNKSYVAEEEKIAAHNGKITLPMFLKFWQLYPKKVDEGKAKSAWRTICGRSADNKPTWREIRRALMFQKESERWQNRKYIPHPTTWLNQSRWLDDPEEMKGNWEDKPKKIVEYGESWYLSTDGRYYNDEGRLLM